MLQTLAKTSPKSPPLEYDCDYDERCFWYDLYARVYEGKFYDHLQYGFHEETVTKNIHKFDPETRSTINAEKTKRISLLSRRPAAQVNLAKIVVNDSTSLLFDDNHFPVFKLEEEKVQEFINDIFENTKFKNVMLKAAIIGSLGSSAIWLRIIKNKIHLKPLKTEYLTPEFDPEDPDVLIRMCEKYKISAKEVRALGYKADEKEAGPYWFCREWTATEEIYYVPWKVIDEKTLIAEGKQYTPTKDESKSSAHVFGFVPFLWIKNLPTLNEDDLDGECTFSSIIPNIIEIDYQLSQLGRGLKYSAEPMLLIKSDEPIAGTVDKSKGNALCLDAEGDAKMLEIKGDFAEVVIKYCETLRKLSLEVVGANRIDPEKLKNAQSGKAIELMNQSLVWLTSKLRLSYGEALVSLIRMIIRATETYPIQIGKNKYKNVEMPKDLNLIWPPYFLPTSLEKQADANTLATLKENGLISTETAVNNLATNYDVIEADDELNKINKEQEENDSREAEKLKNESKFKSKVTND